MATLQDVLSGPTNDRRDYLRRLPRPNAMAVYVDEETLPPCGTAFRGRSAHARVQAWIEKHSPTSLAPWVWEHNPNWR